MATTNKQNMEHDDHKTGLGLKQTIGAFVGIAALLVLLFLGVSNSKEPGAELITDGAKPDQTAYQEDASPLEYEPAILKEYDSGKLLEMEGKIHKVFDEPLKGDANVILNVEPEIESEEVKVNQIILTFVNETPDVEQHQIAHVYGRYIGTLEYEGAVGTMEAPAVQVDYISIEG